jgi:DNA modification methylase
MNNSTAQTIHPFPARMAPEIALDRLSRLSQDSVVLDPMSGSGTVLRQAAVAGHSAIGFDLDPLAVLMSRVSVRALSDTDVGKACDAVLQIAKALDPAHLRLAWIDDDPETKAFIEYWFGESQILELRRLAFVLYNSTDAPGRALRPAVMDALRIALSRIIVTKEQCASLARDTSHSRPHRVSTSSRYSVFDGFERSVTQLRSRLLHSPPTGRAKVSLGDARKIRLSSGSVDAVITSPPYLNAIDYMRGHRLALVWLGFQLSELRSIRSNSIGAERAPDASCSGQTSILRSLGDITALPMRYRRIIDRYIQDVQAMMKEVVRVLKPGGVATFVIGNSCLCGVFIRNSEVLKRSARQAGMTLIEESERNLPAQRRYLPISEAGALGKRMHTETVLTFSSAR